MNLAGAKGSMNLQNQLLGSVARFTAPTVILILLPVNSVEAPIPPKSPSRLTRASSKHKSSGANVRPMPPKDSRSGVPMDKDYRSQRVPIPLEEGPAGDYTSATKVHKFLIATTVACHLYAS